MPIVTTPNVTQSNRTLEATTPLGANALLLTALEGHDYLSKPFKFELTFLSQLYDIPLNSLMCKPVSFKVKNPSNHQQTQQFHGLISNLSRRESNYRGYCQYLTTISPWFCILEYTTDCRIFQNLTIPQIFTQVCKQFGYYDYDISGLSDKYQPLDYCVQYNESYFNFLSRLLEQAGIFYYFRFEQNKHVMVLVDSLTDLPLNQTQTAVHNTATNQAHFHDWVTGEHLTATRVTLGDYNYQSPNQSLQNTAHSALANTNIQGVDNFERFIYPGNFELLSEGQTKAQQQLSSEIGSAHTGQAKGNYFLTAGERFNLNYHEDPAQQGQYIIIGADIKAHDYTHLNDQDQPKDQPAQAYLCDIDFVPMTVGLAPALTTPRPTISGSQSATVIGIDKNTPYTDQYARVKVQFPWNRDKGMADDPACACWIRVAKQSASKGFGTQFIPRPGTEVRVIYHHGNPDRPMITGQMYNAQNPPPFDLPAEQGITGFRSRTVGNSAKTAQSELSFNDTPGKEKITLNAHKNLNVSSKGDMQVQVQGSSTHTIKGDQTHTVHDSIHIQMPSGLDLKAGTGHIKLTPNSVTLEGLQVNLGQTGTAVPLAPKVPVYVSHKYTEKKVKYKFYIVKYDGTKFPFAKSAVDTAIDIFEDIDLTKGFEEERWVHSPDTLGDKAEKKMALIVETNLPKKRLKQSEDSLKNKYLSDESPGIDQDSENEMSEEATVKSAVLGAFTGTTDVIMSAADRSRLRDGLEKLLPKIEPMMPSSGGVLVQADYQVSQTDDGPYIFLSAINPIGKGPNWQPLIKRAMTFPMAIKNPINKANHWEFLFIWVVKEN